LKQSRDTIRRMYPSSTSSAYLKEGSLLHKTKQKKLRRLSTPNILTCQCFCRLLLLEATSLKLVSSNKCDNKLLKAYILNIYIFIECKIIFELKPKHIQTIRQQMWLSLWKGKMPACFHSNMPAHMYMETVQPPETAAWNCRWRSFFPLFLPLYLMRWHWLSSKQGRFIHRNRTALSASTINNSRNKGTKTNVPNKQHCLLIFLHYCQVSGLSFSVHFFSCYFHLPETLTEGSQLTFAFGREKLYRTWSPHFSRVLLSCCKIWWVKTPFLHPHVFWQSKTFFLTLLCSETPQSSSSFKSNRAKNETKSLTLL